MIYGFSISKKQSRNYSLLIPEETTWHDACFLFDRLIWALLRIYYL